MRKITQTHPVAELKSTQNLLHTCDFLSDGWTAQDIIRSHTSLSHIDHFTPYDSFGGHSQINRIVKIQGTFTPQFKSAGGQIFGGSFSHNFTHFGTPSEKDVVKFFFQKGVGFGDTAIYDLNCSRVEISEKESYFFI